MDTVRSPRAAAVDHSTALRLLCFKNVKGRHAKAGYRGCRVVVFLVVGALIVPHVIDIYSYHDQIQSELGKKLGSRVSLGQMSLSLFPPSFQVQSAMIGENGNFPTGRPFIEVEKLAISVKLLPLLSKQVEINSLELVHPHVELIRNQLGDWNFATLGASSAQPNKTASDAAMT